MSFAAASRVCVMSPSPCSQSRTWRCERISSGSTSSGTARLARAEARFSTHMSRRESGSRALPRMGKHAAEKSPSTQSRGPAILSDLNVHARQTARRIFVRAERRCTWPALAASRRFARCSRKAPRVRLTQRSLCVIRVCSRCSSLYFSSRRARLPLPPRARLGAWALSSRSSAR